MNAYLSQAMNMAGSKHHSFHISVCPLHNLPEMKEHVTLKKGKKEILLKEGYGHFWEVIFQSAVFWAEAEKVKLLVFEKFSCIWP